ncbi:MAG: MerR family transcriptional regulator [Candidatus Omnitrophota bacterium]|nr:MerR family transcriptional regulator [Candidatus Omnitrophota bacterium]
MFQEKKNLRTIGDISKLYSFSKATINYYTNMGLLRIAEKQGNKRLYDDNEVRKRLEKIKEMRRSGYSLRLIRKQLTSAP